MNINEFSDSLKEKIDVAALKFNIGGVSIEPKINIRGSGGIYDIPVGGDAKIIREHIDASGKLGFDASTEGGYNFGAGVSGDYVRGRLDYPEEFGALPVGKYGTSGVDINRIDAYLNTPSGFNVGGSYDPRTEDYSVRAGLKVRF